MIVLFAITFGGPSSDSKSQPFVIYGAEEHVTEYQLQYPNDIQSIAKIELVSHSDFYQLMHQIKQDSLLQQKKPYIFLREDVRVRWDGILDILSKTGSSVSSTNQMLNFLKEEVISGTRRSTNLESILMGP